MLSPVLNPACRFYPTCAEYAYRAISRFGVMRGSFLALKRILRCHPLSTGGFDPVPFEALSFIPPFFFTNLAVSTSELGVILGVAGVFKKKNCVSLVGRRTVMKFMWG